MRFYLPSLYYYGFVPCQMLCDFIIRTYEFTISVKGHVIWSYLSPFKFYNFVPCHMLCEFLYVPSINTLLYSATCYMILFISIIFMLFWKLQVQDVFTHLKYIIDLISKYLIRESLWYFWTIKITWCNT